MVTFDVISKTPEFRGAYREAVHVAGLNWEVIEASYKRDRDVKVLDLGGGSGTLGDILSAEFGPMVEYVNFDINPKDLERSKGRKIQGDYTSLGRIIGAEEFDFVFALNIYNPPPPVSKRTYDAMAADGHGLSKRRGLFCIPTLADHTIEAEATAANSYERLVLLNQILATSPQGVLVRGNIIFRDPLEGLKKYMEDYGFSHLETASMPLSRELAEWWASYDTFGSVEANGIKIPLADIQQYQKGWKAVAFKRGRPINKDKLTKKIEEAHREQKEARSFLETQARFWD